MALLASSARSAPALPTCWPGLTNAAGYRGTFPVIGESAQCRWANWLCYHADSAANPDLAYAILGTKSVPITTLLGRLLTIERATDANRAAVFELMWKAYVTTDPATDAELAQCRVEMRNNP